MRALSLSQTSSHSNSVVGIPSLKQDHGSNTHHPSVEV